MMDRPQFHSETNRRKMLKTIAAGSASMLSLGSSSIVGAADDSRHPVVIKLRGDDGNKITQEDVKADIHSKRHEITSKLDEEKFEKIVKEAENDDEMLATNILIDENGISKFVGKVDESGISKPVGKTDQPGVVTNTQKTTDNEQIESILQDADEHIETKTTEDVRTQGISTMGNGFEEVSDVTKRFARRYNNGDWGADVQFNIYENEYKDDGSTEAMVLESRLDQTVFGEVDRIYPWADPCRFLMSTEQFMHHEYEGSKVTLDDWTPNPSTEHTDDTNNDKVSIQAGTSGVNATYTHTITTGGDSGEAVVTDETDVFDDEAIGKIESSGAPDKIRASSASICKLDDDPSGTYVTVSLDDRYDLPTDAVNGCRYDRNYRSGTKSGHFFVL